MDGSEPEAPLKAADKPDNVAPALPLDIVPCPLPISAQLNPSPPPSSSPAVQSMPRSHIPQPNPVVSENVDPSQSALAGSKRKLTAEPRPPAKKPRPSLDLENNQVLPAPCPPAAPNPSLPSSPPPPPPQHYVDDPPDHNNGQPQDRQQDQVFQSDFDHQGYGDAADRAKLLEMPELQRKKVLEDRIRRRPENKLQGYPNRMQQKAGAPYGGDALQGETDASPDNNANINTLSADVHEVALVRLNAKIEGEEDETQQRDAQAENNNVGDSNNGAAGSDNVSAAASTVGRPFLRSSPITPKQESTKEATSPTAPSTNTAPTSTPPASTASASPAGKNANATLTARKKERGNKKRSVSWAKDDDLVQVVPIDNRMELIKSWDPESEITLPFTPMTLMQFRQAIANEAADSAGEPGAAENGSSDAFAPDNEQGNNHNTNNNNASDDEEQRRRIRDHKRKKLDEMQPSIEWPQKGTQVVLPPECKPEEVAVKFTLHAEMDDGEVTSADDSNGAHDASYSPRSPPPEDDHYQNGGNSAYEIPWIDPANNNNAMNNGGVENNNNNGMGGGEQSMHQVAQHQQQHNGSTYSNGAGGNNVAQLRSQQQAHAQHRGYGGNQHHQPYGANRTAAAYMNSHGHNQAAGAYGQMNGGGMGMPHNSGRNSGYRGGGGMGVPDIAPVDLQSLLQALHHQGVHPPPPPPPPPVAPPYGTNGVGQYYPVQMGAQMMGANNNGSNSNNSSGGDYGLPPPQLAQKLMSGRNKMKKKCKWFASKGTCRDGDACMYSHAP